MDIQQHFGERYRAPLNRPIEFRWDNTFERWRCKRSLCPGARLLESNLPAKSPSSSKQSKASSATCGPYANSTDGNQFHHKWNGHPSQSKRSRLSIQSGIVPAFRYDNVSGTEYHWAKWPMFVSHYGRWNTRSSTELYRFQCNGKCGSNQLYCWQRWWHPTILPRWNHWR